MTDNSNIISESTKSLLLEKNKIVEVVPKYTKKIKEISELSKVGYSGPGVKKTNQDNKFIIKNLLNDVNNFYFGVCDGHGMFGHDVSKFIKDILPNEINSELTRNTDPSKRNYIIEQVFLNVNFKLFNDSNIDTAFSGSTCVTVICTADSLICANIGDSRAVLGRCVDGSKDYFK
jgi:serine/threonine protein phosphatase PrpC